MPGAPPTRDRSAEPRAPTASDTADLRPPSDHPTEPPASSPLGRAPALALADREFKHQLRAQLFGKPLEPLRIGRFTVLRQLGAGGMGVVYAAYDDQLDRKVALKLLHAHRSGAADQRRLLREAQALARLAHPNVVGIHEVGVFDGQVFLAMEFVHGQTAHAWRTARPRRWRDVLDVYLQAGRGLAAAHAVGLVHGDFKPENIIVGVDGRVRVLDFGLARPSDPAIGETCRDDQPRDEPSALAVTAGLAGTPAYMAAEQLDGARPDPRSDQFSFCVALFEALHGQRPYQGASLDELAHAVRSGRIAVPAGDLPVPGWLRRVVLRGLARDPAARWPAMPALLAALDRQPRRARWLAAALASLAAALALGLLFPARERAPCTGAADELAGVWDPERRQALAAAFGRIGAPFAAAAWSRTERLLDAHFAAWAAMARDSCEATHVRGTQSSELLDLRAACLHRRRDEVRALTDLFAAADAQVVARAVQAVGLLAPIDACADQTALSAAAPPPDDLVLRARIERARARLAPLGALLRTGKYEEGRAGAQNLVDEAMALGHLPLTAEALLLSGELHAALGDLNTAERLLADAARAGAGARDDALIARAWTLLVAVVGVDQARPADGRAWARVADVAVVRAGDDSRLRAALLVHEGALARERGDHDDALARLQRALALQEQVLAPDDPALADTLDHLGLALAAAGEYDGAIASHRRALALRERALGPDHPDLAVTRQRLDTALAAAQRSAGPSRPPTPSGSSAPAPSPTAAAPPPTSSPP
ncbi:protein kinase domain-containing protein [Nannocystis radixulma]|uniref:Protein kinase n=1 Tax=Nannocystis radixulma TaxID=2995305 RepID=A0ABT5B0S3_9BACT|nr:protein kinase [Nannocystis radixulma]MDC0667695.1 protein kinase [Nannocystis radixulma]